MPKGRSTFEIREPTRTHLTKYPRPHLAQEYIETNRYEEAENITRCLTPHAAMCAKGEVSAGFKRA